MAKDGADFIRLSFVVTVFVCLLLPQVMCLTRRPCKNIIATDKTEYFKYPESGHYPRSTFQCLLIKADHNWDKVKISFKSFMLEPHKYCSHDNLTIYDGDDYTADIIGTYCGNNVPDDIVSDDDAIYMEFRSDDYVEYDGFKFSYVAGEEDDLESSKKEEGDDDDDYDESSYEKKKKHKLTTVIVGLIIGSLVLITGIVATVCICFSTRRCRCRPGSRSVNPSDEIEDRGEISNRRTFLQRTDRTLNANSPANLSSSYVERQGTGFPFPVFLPTYTDSAPPPYNGHEVIELQRIPSSPPPPYTLNDPNPLFFSLGDINVPSNSEEIAFRY